MAAVHYGSPPSYAEATEQPFNLRFAQVLPEAPLWKVAVFVVVISGLILGSIALGGLAANLACVPHPWMWQIVLAGGGCAVLGISALAGLAIAHKHRMLQNTETNGKDALEFTGSTIFFALYGLFLVMDCAERVGCLECLFELANNNRRRVVI